MSAKTIRPFVLLTFVLGSIGCSEAPTQAAQPTSVEKARAAKKKEELPRSLDPALMTATAPTKVRSVLDAPKASPTPEPVLPAAQDAKETERASEAKVTDDVDYARPLSPDEVQVDRFVLATAVSEREPSGESDVFTTDTKKIFAFVQLANPTGAPYSFRVHWEPVDGPASPYGVALKVETAPRYRTWSWTAIKRMPGRYKAVLRTLDGEDIASREFVIEPAPAEVDELE